MPELPEVETTRRGIAPHVTGRTIRDVVVRNAHLRWPVPRRLRQLLQGKTMQDVGRRGKYLLLTTDGGTLIMHLGMSGSLRILPSGTTAGKHDHVDILLDDDRCLRLNDPRRFGSIHWTTRDPALHPLLRDLGPEPLGTRFDAGYLHGLARGRRIAVKQFIMDSHVVVGVGNIYANEALYRAGIHPARAAGRISQARYARLAMAIREVIRDAITHGGTTLRDFVASDGRPGYFRHELQVYGRAGEPCAGCGATLRHITQGQRSTFYCPRCQR